MRDSVLPAVVVAGNPETLHPSLSSPRRLSTDETSIDRSSVMARKFDPVCTPVFLPDDNQVEAAKAAVEINPVNKPNTEQLSKALTADGATPKEVAQKIAVMTSKYWGPEGVRLTVGFPWGSPAVALKKRIVEYMHKWNQYGNVEFVYTEDARPHVRCSLGAGGYWAFLGPDILQIPVNQQNLNLEKFSLNTPESEYDRVVPHEAGHILGFPHEHMRRDIIADLDAEKVIAEFMHTQGWSRQDVIAQILTPLEESEIIATPTADTTSIMCYQMPARLTKSGKPVLGGARINQDDANFVARIYPKPGGPPPEGGDDDYKVRVRQYFDEIMESADDQWYGMKALGQKNPNIMSAILKLADDHWYKLDALVKKIRKEVL